MFTSSRKHRGQVDDEDVVDTGSYTIEQPAPSAADYYARTGAIPPSGEATFGSSSAHRGDTTIDSANKTNGTSSSQHSMDPSCCTRLKKELNLCQPWFYVADPTTGRKIDVAESFAPDSGLAILLKLVITGLTVSTLIATWVKTTDAAFYLAYFTHWGLLLSALYACSSLWNSIWSSRTVQPPDRASCRIRTTWVLFTMAAHTEVLVTLLWWSFVYEPGSGVSYLDVMPHAVVMVLVWFDGFFINCIPMRWMHYFGFVLTLNLVYVLWTVLQSPVVFDLGNPGRSDNDPETNDDAIYTALDWEDDPLGSAVLVIIFVLGVGPFVFLIMWLVSLYRCGSCSRNASHGCCTDRRRYIDSFRDEEEEEHHARVEDVEEGSIFARWF